MTKKATADTAPDHTGGGTGEGAGGSTDAATVEPTTRTVGFLGPHGTFSEQVVEGDPALAGCRRVPFGLMTDVIFAVANGEVDFGVVPVENAIEGSVNAVIDTMAFDVDVLILREHLEPVTLDLLTLPDAPLSGIRKVFAIPVAAAQCRTWTRENLPGVEHVPANSNAEAAELAAAQNDPAVAAIANTRAGRIYGLVSAVTGIQDHSDNATRFAVIGRGSVPPPTGHDKTSIVVFQRADEPGSLLAILQEFAARGINLTLLLSRPTKRSLGDYCFILDMEGHVSDPVVADCLRNLHAKHKAVKFLGSYPTASANGHELREHVNDRMTAASEWVSGLQGMIG